MRLSDDITHLTDHGMRSHMPFLAAGPNGPVLFCCRSTGDGIWKAHYVGDDGLPRRLRTGLAEDATECSPAAWHDSAGWHVSFIGGGAAPTRLFRLYRMDGPSLDTLSEPVPVAQARSGFIYRDRLAAGEATDFVHINEPAEDQTLEFPGANILRVGYRADQPELLLISGRRPDEPDPWTIEYDLTTGEQRRVICDGRPAYKCAMLGDRVLYADRRGGFEEREVVEAQTTEREPVAVARKLGVAEAAKVKKPCGGCGGKKSTAATATAEPTPGTTRPSCLECVEKHLGAAAVLLAEVRDGYAHRLLVIGHLHEAEDESQEWSALHDAIRDGRKAWQADGESPDWNRLGELVEEVRRAG
jgi:hypothetical protein